MLGIVFKCNSNKISCSGKFLKTCTFDTELTFIRPAEVTEKCHPGLHTPVPAGFYLNDVWTSFVCSTHHFTTQMTTECLKDKHIYMMGDSTIRQWFEFFVKAIPSEINSCLFVH